MDIIRVGTMNNFDMSETEFEALKKYERDDRKFFVNSNSFTEIKSKYPSFVTINPYLKFQEPKGDISNIKACRVKVFATTDKDNMKEQTKAITWAIKHKIPVLITFMRFRSKKSLEKFKVCSEYYEFNKNWYSPVKEYRYSIKKMLDTMNNNLINYCDLNGTGCPNCGNCIKLSQNVKSTDGYTLHSIDLSCSGNNGVCKYNCPDCWAKSVLNLNGGKPKCDTIKANRKQTGKFIHK